MSQAVDPAIVVPALNLGEALRFLVYLAAVVCLPGWAIRCLLGIRPAEWPERWALTAVFGVLWLSGLYFGLGLLGRPQWHLIPVGLPVLIVGLCAVWRRLRQGTWNYRGVRQRHDSHQTQGSASAPEGLCHREAVFQSIGLLLVAAFVAYYLARTASCVEYDATGLRLYGAFYSDKMTNMSPCAALLHGVPPQNLRLAGYTFPYHYFPHLFVAATSWATGIDYVDGFWFYAAALGIGVSGLAVLAFCRRALGSYALGCLGLVFFGLLQFTIEAKPLDLSIALLLLGLVSIDRAGERNGCRWAALAVGLWAAMPLYEVFHAAAALAGLGIWTLASLGQGWREMRWRSAAAGATALGAVLLVQLLCLGQEVVQPTRFVATNAYRESYKREWIDLLRASSDEHPLLAEVFWWKRGRAGFLPGAEARPTRPKPALWQRVVGEVLFELGCVGYVFLRYGNLALFGALALAAAFWKKTRPWRASDGIVASIALVGFGLPCVVTWGHVADGQWWETPNLYRPTTCAYLLLLLVGTGAMVAAFRAWRCPRNWLLIGLVVWQAWGLAVGLGTPATSFHHVDRDRLEALAFLRANVPFGEVVIHPWIDDLIREDREPGKISWVYKRHFTLGSNLAGQQMYYEGREDHLFIGGFVDAEEVYRRSRLRRAFYASPERSTVEEVVQRGGVRWVVADRDHPAPPSIAGSWEVAFGNATVRIYRRPPAQ